MTHSSDNSGDTSWESFGKAITPHGYRKKMHFGSNFSTASLFSVSSTNSSTHTAHLSNLSLGWSSSSLHVYKKPPKQRLSKLITKCLKHTVKNVNKNVSEDINVEFWKLFYKKLRKIIHAFDDKLSIYDALNEAYSGKSSPSASCSSIIHILCKQLCVYSQSNQWIVADIIWDSIKYIIENGSNPSIYYIKKNLKPQRNYIAIHKLYQGLDIMLNNEIIDENIFINNISYVVSYGHYDIIDNIFEPAVLTLCLYKKDNEYQNITYWFGDCIYNDYYVYLISPLLAKSFIMTGYDILHIANTKHTFLDYNDNATTSTLINDPNELQEIIQDDDDNDDKIHDKVIAFLWFMRYGNYKSDLINLVDIGIKQLALDEFSISIKIIRNILTYSHTFVMKNTDNNSILNLPYFDADKWMMIAFESIFSLNNSWIDYIGEYVMPLLTNNQIIQIKKDLSQHTSDKQWNKFIRRISLKSISSFCSRDIFGIIDSDKMQNIILQNYKFNTNDLIPIIKSANYNTQQTFGNSLILYSILNDIIMEASQIKGIFTAIHERISCSSSLDTSKLIINDIIFGCKWIDNDIIWKNILLIFNCSQYIYFNNALNSLLFELSTKEHYIKLIHLMKYNIINFNYCLHNNCILPSFQSLLQDNFDKKVHCIQLIGDWIWKEYENEKNIKKKKEIAKKAIVVISSVMTSMNYRNDNNNSGMLMQDRDQVIIEQYLHQLKTGLSR